jgi:hypothetical protein
MLAHIGLGCSVTGEGRRFKPSPATNEFSCRRNWWFALMLAHIGLGCTVTGEGCRIRSFHRYRCFKRAPLGPFLQASESIYKELADLRLAAILLVDFVSF